MAPIKAAGKYRQEGKTYVRSSVSFSHSPPTCYIVERGYVILVLVVRPVIKMEITTHTGGIED